MAAEASSAPSTSAPSTCLRILCLHAGESNAAELHEALQRLDKRLYEKHKVELVYINGPMKTSDDHYVWWEEDDNDDHEYLGLDASLLHVRQVLGSMPFSGILGVGQGAGLASLLPLMGVEQVEFGILVHGHSLLEEDERLLDDWPVLHVGSSERLVVQFGGETHDCKTQQLGNADLNAIGKFIVEQKKRLCCGNNEIILQNQLHAVETEAADLVAKVASEHPPKALMAVIASKSRLGAWSGGHKPEKPGGGAPCPSEFLLRKEERVDDDKEQG